MQGPEHAIELFHGYTYSGHPLACAAALATLDVYRDERLFERAKSLEPKWCDAVMSLKGLPNVVDIRCVGLTGAIDLAPIPGSPTLRGYRVLEHSFHEAGDHAAHFRRHDRTDAAAHHQLKTRSARSWTRSRRRSGRRLRASCEARADAQRSDWRSSRPWRRLHGRPGVPGQSRHAAVTPSRNDRSASLYCAPDLGFP